MSNIIKLSQVSETDQWKANFFFDCKTFMVCVDQSNSCKLALVHALNLMKPKDKLLLAHISHGAKKESGDAYLAHLGGLVNDWDDSIVYEKLNVEGDAREGICKLAKEKNVDYIFVGTRGMGGVRNLLLGSVSSFLTQHAPCPVTVVREKES